MSYIWMLVVLGALIMLALKVSRIDRGADECFGIDRQQSLASQSVGFRVVHGKACARRASDIILDDCTMIVGMTTGEPNMTGAYYIDDDGTAMAVNDTL